MNSSIVTSGLLATAIAFPVFATASVGLRLWGRQLLRHIPLCSSDYTMFVTLFFCWCFSITTFVAAGQIGVNELKVSMTDGIVISQRMLWAGSYLLLGALCAVKISCLQFYAQMFVTKRFVMAVNIMNVVLVAWFIVHVFCFLFSQDPVLTLWSDNPLNIKLRYDYGTFILASSTISLLLDIVVLVFPIPCIKTLKLDRRQKISIIAMFSLGAFCCIASAARFYYLYRDIYKTKNIGGTVGNPFVFATQYTLWQHVEPNASVIAACLPTYGAFFARRRKASVNDSLNAGKLSGSSMLDSRDSSRNGSAYDFTDVDKDPRFNKELEVESGLPPVPPKDPPLRIGVTKTVEVRRGEFR